MASAFLQLIICFPFLSLVSALLCNPQTQRRSLAPAETGNTSTKSEQLTLAIPPRSVTCLAGCGNPNLTDCAFILNDILLREESVFEGLSFSLDSYRTAAGDQALSQWRHGECQVSVNGKLGETQSLRLFDIALTANRIIAVCNSRGVSHAKGGTSLIGDVMKGFFVNVEGYPLGDSSVAVNFTSVDPRPATGVSKGAPESRQGRESL